jgi:hypothetical protein
MVAKMVARSRRSTDPIYAKGNLVGNTAKMGRYYGKGAKKGVGGIVRKGVKVGKKIYRGVKTAKKVYKVAQKVAGLLG